jgi:histidyl-tRNA synthetase
MPFKRKKTGNLISEAHSRGTLSVAPAYFNVEKERFGSGLVKLLGTLGFQQTFPLPVEERQWFLKHPYLENEFAPRLLELSVPLEKDWVLPPTYFLGTFRRFSQNLASGGPRVVKWFYLAPTFETQEGKFGQSRHELGIFVLGKSGSLANSQLLHAVCQFLRSLGVEDFVTEINSLGCEVCQKDFFNTLLPHLRDGQIELCENCKERFEDQPFAIFNCLEPSCQTLVSSAPQIVDFLDNSCRSTLIGVLEAADELGLPYNLNPCLAHGLFEDQVIFRILVQSARTVLGYGGDYARVYSRLTETSPPLLGFLTTLEQLWEVIPEDRRTGLEKVEVFLVALGEAAARRLLVLHRDLLAAGIKVAEGLLTSGGIRSQFKEAQERNSEIALIVGQKEALDQTVILRDMRSGMQEVLAFDQIIEEVKKRLGK